MRSHSLRVLYVSLSLAAAAPHVASQAFFSNGRVITKTTPQDHPDAFKSMVNENFRMISIDVWGPKDLGTLTAIWEPNPGPAWQSFHFLKPSTYQSQFNALTAIGFKPSRVCHSGRHSERYACIFVDDGVPAFGRHGQSYEDFKQTMNDAKAQGFILESLSVSGSPRKFASVWRANPEQAKWHLIGGLPPSSYQDIFSAMTSLGYGPHTVACWKDARNSEDSLYYAVMRKNVGYSWKAYHSVNIKTHDDFMVDLRNDGYRPRHVARDGETYIGVWEK